MPAPHNSETIHGIEVRFVGVVENHKQISLGYFNGQMTSSLRQNDQNFGFLRNLAIKIRKVKRSF